MNYNRPRTYSDFNYSHFTNNTNKILKKQDDDLDNLLKNIIKQKEIASLINTELQSQQPLILKLHKRTISCNDIVYRENIKLEKFNINNQNWFINTLFYPFKFFIIKPVNYFIDFFKKDTVYNSNYPEIKIS